jgi:ABC-type branched-subunit amino acid transport system ATPase component/ABC-type branched-subunit amino acid transport system permease subunit
MTERLKRLPKSHLAAAVVLLLLVLYPVVNPWHPYSQGVMLLAFSLAVQASGWNIISGYAGYTSLGHSMFLGLGSYTVAIVALHTGVNPLWIAPLGGVTAMVIAVLVGAVVLRTRGHAFVIITIAVLLAAQIIATNWDGLTNGSDGITLELPFWNADYQNIPFYYLFLGLLVLSVLFSAWIRRTKFGTGLVAIREDEGKAAAIGVDTTRFKIVAYAASTFFIGVAGGFYAYFLTFLNPVGAFAILGSVMIVLSALVGGRGTLYGPVVGAFIVQGLNEAATVYGGGSSRVLWMGLALVVVVLFMPAGLLPTAEKFWRSRRPQTVEFTDQRGALAKSTAGDAPAPADVVDAAEDPDAAEVAAVTAPAVVAETRERALEELAASAAEDHLAAGEPLLEIRGAAKRFGGLVAVDGADLTVRKGTITALIGPNGSGKTTLFNLITGNMAADAGEIRFEGKRIDKLPPWKRGHLGLGRTFQTTRLFNEMTVLENVVAPLPDGRWRTMFADAVSGDEADRARELLDVVGLGRFAAQRAGDLSYGQMKLVELAQVLMLEPKLILLDEPAGGVNPSLLGRLTEVIRELNARGISFLVVEHNIPMVLDLCDPVIVFSRGRPIAEGHPHEIRHDPVVLDAYLGDDWRPARTPGAATGDTPGAAPGHQATELSTTERG